MTISLKDIKTAMHKRYIEEHDTEAYQELYHALLTLRNNGLISWDDFDKIYNHDWELYQEANK